MRAVRLAIVAAAVVFVGLVWSGWPLSGYRDADYVGFWAGSRMLLDGVDPYDPVAWRATIAKLGSLGLALNVPGAGYGYPLTAAVLFVPFALLPIAIAAPLWLVLQIVLGTAALVFFARTLFPRTLSRDRPVLLAFAAASQPVWVLAASGNVGGFLLAIAAIASALLLRGQALAAGAVAGLLVMKPHPLLVALLLIVVVLPRREALRAVGGAVATGGAITVISLALRPGWVGEFLVSLRGLSDASVARASLFGALASFGPLAWAAAAGLISLVLAWELRMRPPLTTTIAAAIPVSLIIAPYIWSYDHSVLLVSVACIIAAVAGGPTAMRAAILGLLGIVAVVLPWTLYWIAFQRGDEAWSVAVPIAMLAVVALSTRASGGAAATQPSSDGYGTMPS